MLIKFCVTRDNELTSTSIGIEILISQYDSNQTMMWNLTKGLQITIQDIE